MALIPFGFIFHWFYTSFIKDHLQTPNFKNLIFFSKEHKKIMLNDMSTKRWPALLISLTLVKNFQNINASVLSTIWFHWLNANALWIYTLGSNSKYRHNLVRKRIRWRNDPYFILHLFNFHSCSIIGFGDLCLFFI